MIRHISQCQDYLCHQFVWAVVLASPFKWGKISTISALSVPFPITKPNWIYATPPPGTTYPHKNPADNLKPANCCSSDTSLYKLMFFRSCWMIANKYSSAPNLRREQKIHIEALWVPSSILSSDVFLAPSFFSLSPHTAALQQARHLWAPFSWSHSQPHL